jgi:hypothetical protein
VRFELSVTDYRSIKDFIGAATSCEADERVWSDFRVLLASGQLARRQTEYERHILARGDLLWQIRRSQAEYSGARYTGRLLIHAQQVALLPKPDDAYWTEHFRERAVPLDACIRQTAIRGRAQYAAIWDAATAIFANAVLYPNWATAIAASDDADSAALRAAESELVAIRRLLTVGDLATLDTLNLESLTHLTAQLEAMLEAGYARITHRIETDPTPIETRIGALTALGDRTACLACKVALQRAAETLRAAAMAAPPVQSSTSQSQPPASQIQAPASQAQPSTAQAQSSTPQT